MRKSERPVLGRGDVDSDPKGLANHALDSNRNYQRITRRAEKNAPSIVATKEIARGEQIDAQNIALNAASGTDNDSDMLQTLFGKTAKVHIPKGAKIEAQLLENH